MKNKPVTHPETLVAQADHFLDPASGAIVPPLSPSTTYARTDDYQLRGKTSYLRGSGANWEQVEGLMAKLEGGPTAAVFASGMAAGTAAVMALKPGDHLIMHETIYWGFAEWLLDFCPRWGIELTSLDLSLPGALAGAMKPGKTKLVWIETPTNPIWQVLDIAELAQVAHASGARLAVDSTVATPVQTRPLELGADLVMHSATKYLNGHSDVLAGVLVPAREDDFWTKIMANRNQLGASLGTFEAWLLLRGLRTLYVRVERSSRTALFLAEAMAKHKGIERVLYPGLPTHPGHAIAKKQMQGGYGGMLSLLVKGGREEALKMVKAVKVFHRATSLGSVESLIEHRASVEGAVTKAPQNLLRLSIGLEHPDDLLADLEQALV